MGPTEARAASIAHPWIDRLRLLVSAAAFFALLHYGLGATVMPRGLGRPMTIAAAPLPLLATAGLILLIPLGAAIGAVGAQPWRPGRGLIALGLGLAAWAALGGTIDHWLILAAGDGSVGPPSAAPYYPLLGEYLLLAVLLLASAIVDEWLGPPAARPTLRLAARRAVGLEDRSASIAAGMLALATTTAVIAVLMLLLTGRAVGWTLRGQVYFAVAAAAFLGVSAAVRLSAARHPIWYWPAPLLAGTIGAAVACVRPGLLIPEDYSHLNSIPAWGLVRALPVEMAGVGVATVLATLYAGISRTHAAER